MNINEAQSDMRYAYMAGSTGILISGLIWIIAGLISFFHSNQLSIIIFFLGGMFIHPMGILLDRLFNRPGKHDKNNPLSHLTLESTLILFIGLFISYSIYHVKADWFFPIMLLIIGCRYVLFNTIYGIKLYWVLGLTLVFFGTFLILNSYSFYIGAIAGGIIEMIFGTIIFSKEINSKLNKQN